MKTLKFLYLPAICWIMIVLTGCYKDLGNYDYDPSFGDVQITFVPSSNFNAVAGQEFSMRATVVSKSTGDSTRFFNENDYEFEWYANGDILSTDKNYTGICMLPVGQAQGVYSVINKKTGERTMAKYVINVSSAINIGWMILADKGGKSDLTYIRWQNPTSGSVFTPFLNAYALFNQGAELGSQPIKMVEHYAYMTGESEVLVIQKGGQGPVELSGKTLAKVVTMKEEFLDGEFPEGFVAKDAFYFGISDFVLDETGRVFSKTSANPSDQSPLYMSHHRRYNTFPVTVEGGWKIKNFVGSDFQSGTLLFFDENRKGYFATVNSAYEGDMYQLISPAVSGASFPIGFTPVHNYGTTVPVHSNMTTAYPKEVRSILKTASGDYRYQRFQANHSPWTYNVTCLPLAEEELPIKSYVTDKSLYEILRMRNFIIFTGGPANDKLYYCNLATKAIGLYHDFNGVEIKKITINRSAGNARNREEHLAVGLANGDFVIYNVPTPVLTGGTSEEVYRLTGLGNIVDIIYKAYNFGNSL